VEGFWAITSYYNPAGYERRLRNYHTFRGRLDLPLVTVEHSSNGDFQLSRADADVLIQLHSPDVMWHKERLLNIALGALPTMCRKVAWLDCDVVFDQRDWSERADRALNQYGLLQLFEDVFDVRREAGAHQVDLEHSDCRARSIASGLAAGKVTVEMLGRPLRLEGWNSGLAWASRRDILVKHGLYDACISGMGDRAILCAAVGQFEAAVRNSQMTPSWRTHYLAWAGRYFETLRGSVGVIEGKIFHLWHGDLRDRQYAERVPMMMQFDYDPATDVALDAHGCWRWSSDKPHLHQYLKDFFRARKEDG